MPDQPTVLHYLGADDDHGGIVSVVRALAASGRFACVLGVNPGFEQHRADPLPIVSFPRLRAEKISLVNFWRARTTARAVQAWLRRNDRAVFHGHTRGALLVALWLDHFHTRRVAVSVHCYGRQRWFYRRAAGRLQTRLFWLTPAMKTYYAAGARTWERCIPNSLPGAPLPARRRLLRPGKLALGGAGMLVRWKRWERVLEALSLLPASSQRAITFTHIGATEPNSDSLNYAHELRAATERLGLVAQVAWQGWQPSAAQLLTEVDAMVVPSRLEPFSMIALEALFAGVPVIAANEGGPTDLIASDRNGWFYDGGSAQSLADRLGALLDSDALTRVTVAAEDLARFKTSTVSQQWADVYASLLTQT